VPNPLPEAPTEANWVEAFWKELASDPQASRQDSEAGPSGSSQNPDILPKFTYNDEMAYASLLTTRVPSRPVQRTKPYDRKSSSRSARTRNQNQEEGDRDIVEVMHRAIFNGAFMPDPPEVVKMARKCLHPTLDLHSNDLANWNMTAEGQGGVMRLLGVLEDLRDDMKSLARPWVVLEYQIPLHTQTTPVVKLFVERLITDYQYLKGPIQVRGVTIDLLFGHRAVIGFVKYLLFHDRQYWRYISSTQNVEPLLAYSSTLHTWALNEISSGSFIAIDFDIVARQPTYKVFVKLFRSLTADERDGLSAHIMARP
ncbi:hypothetical protein CY34DRAFT_111022, partial [Suillus luteus UH-Slu-Lm8-n1]